MGEVIEGKVRVVFDCLQFLTLIRIPILQSLRCLQFVVK